MFGIGDKITAYGRNRETGQRFAIPQRIIGEGAEVRSDRTYEDGSTRTFVNTVAPVLAKHPVTGVTYIRPAEVLNFAIPRFTEVEGLDVLDGKALSLQALMAIHETDQLARLEAQDAASLLVDVDETLPLPDTGIPA